MKKLILSTLHLIIATMILAQAPHMFNFQFVARDASDNLLLNQDISVRIGIRSGHSSGTEVFAETHQITTNAYGMASLTIGSGTAIVGGSLSSISWGSNQYFVQISLDPAGGSAFQSYGTTQLLSVPYAIYAGNSGNSSGWQTSGNSGNTSANFVGNTDNVPLSFRVNNEPSGSITSSGQQFFGYQAGQNNMATTSTAMGFRALRMNTSGARNTAAGYEALRDNTVGQDNTAIGGYALQRNTIGNSNLAIGVSALQYNTSGNNNIALGLYALFGNSTGSGNIAIGNAVMHNNTEGADNLGIGFLALRLNTTGRSNVALGPSSLFLNTIGSNNTAIGEQVMSSNVSGNYNSAFGSNALNTNTSGTNNAAFGYEALSINTTGSNNIGIGFQANVPSATGNNQVRIGNSSISYAGVEVPWTTTSDRRTKQNIKASELGLDFVLKLNPVVYTRTSDAHQKLEYGFIAQEVEQALTDSDAAADGFITIDDQGKYGLRYNDLLAPMVKAIQEQQEVISKQELLIMLLAGELEQMKKQLKQLNLNTESDE